MWAWHVKMAYQNLLRLLMMINSFSLLRKFLTVLKSFSRLESNSLIFQQLVKAVKTLTVGATWSIIIGPESDHWQCLSLTHWLTDSRLVNLIDVTLACEDGNSKLVEVVTVVEVDDEKRVDNSLVQILKVNFGHNVKFLFGLWGQGFKVCSRFWSWCSGKILKLKFGHYFAADAWLWLWSSFLVEILVWFGQDF